MIVYAFVTCALISTIVYLWFVVRAIMGMAKAQQQVVGEQTHQAMSVIVPYRNEAKHLPQLLESVKLAILNAPQQIQVILVNDHSDDGFTVVNSEFECFDLAEMTGKKAAIDLGLANARHERILTLDADVLIDPEFFRSLDTLWTDQDLFIIPVVGKGGNALLEVESHAICALTVGSAMNNNAIMCNGAALAFKKSQLLDVEIKHKDVASGDDMFLLEAFKKGKKSIFGTVHKKVIVSTQLPTDLSSFIHQRVRWAGKSRHASDPDLIIFGTATMLMYLCLLLSFLVLSPKSFATIFAVYGVKLFIDFLLLFLFHIKTGLNGKWWAYPIIGIAYPLYSLYIGLMSILIKPKWKGRQV